MTTYEKIVKGATKLKLAAPKTKYIEPILIVTHSARDTHDEDFRIILKTLATRLQDSAWTVAYKSLLVIHIMIREGEGDLTLQYLSSQYKILDCRNVSKASSTGSGGDVKALKSYAKYLLTRAKEYGLTRVDYVRDERLHNAVSRNPESGGRLRRLSVEKGVLREVESVQRQIDSLLRCKFQESEVNNDVILTGFRMLVHDLLSLYQSLNEGVINLLEHYFEMSKYDADRALEIYKVFVDQTKDVVAYLRVAKRLEYATKLHVPTIKHAPTALAGSLEEYLRDPNFEVNRKQYLAEKEGKAKTGSSADLTKTGPPQQKQPQQIQQVQTQTPVPAPQQQLPQQVQQQQQQPQLVFQQQTGFNPWNFPTQSATFAPQQLAVAPLFTSQPAQQASPMDNIFSSQPANHQVAAQAPASTQAQPQIQTQPTGGNANMIPIQKTGITVQQSNLIPLQATATGFTPAQQAPPQPQQQPQQQPPQPQQPQQQPPLNQQATGFFSQRPNSTIVPAFTGAGFGGYGTQPVQAQTTGNPFLTNNTPSSNSNLGFVTASSTFTGTPQPAAPLKLQYTSSQTTLQRSKTNPFALGNIPESSQPSPLKATDPTTNPFSSKVEAAKVKTMPLQVMHTGTNPFRNDTPSAAAPLRPQLTAGGLENLPTIPVFPDTQREFKDQQLQLKARYELEQQKLALQQQQQQQQQQTGSFNMFAPQLTGFQQQQTGNFNQFAPQLTGFQQQQTGNFNQFAPQLTGFQQPTATGNPFFQQQPVLTNGNVYQQPQQHTTGAYDGPSLI